MSKAALDRLITDLPAGVSLELNHWTPEQATRLSIQENLGNLKLEGAPQVIEGIPVWQATLRVMKQCGECHQIEPVEWHKGAGETIQQALIQAWTSYTDRRRHD